MRRTLVPLGVSLVFAGAVTPLWSWMGVQAHDTHHTGRSVARSLRIADVSGNQHHGVMQGYARMGLRGYRKTAVSFLEAGSYVHVPPSPDLNPGRRDFLIAARVKFRSVPQVGGTYDIIRKGIAESPFGDYKLEIVDPGHVRCTFKDSDRNDERVELDGAVIGDGRWHYVACARTGGFISVMVDEKIATRQVSLGWIGNTMPLAIGSKYGWEDQSPGRLDEVVLIISDRASRPHAHIAPRRAISALTSQSPVGLWPLDERPLSR